MSIWCVPEHRIEKGRRRRHLVSSFACRLPFIIMLTQLVGCWLPSEYKQWVRLPEKIEFDISNYRSSTGHLTNHHLNIIYSISKKSVHASFEMVSIHNHEMKSCLVPAFRRCCITHLSTTAIHQGFAEAVLWLSVPFTYSYPGIRRHHRIQAVDVHDIVGMRRSDGYAVVAAGRG